jgi:hypothetical protein
MEEINVVGPRNPGEGFRIEDFPDAVRVIAIKGESAKRIAHLVLHRSDLLFAKSCLESLALGQHEPIRSALWNSSLVALIKCFSNSKSRFKLEPKVLYHESRSHKLTLEVFEFFRNLRNKHIVHDDNSFLQGMPGAIVNTADSAERIAGIVTFTAHVDVLGQEAFSNLLLLIDSALEWVAVQHEQCCQAAKAELEKLPHADLLKFPEVEYSKPQVADVGKQRP